MNFLSRNPTKFLGSQEQLTPGHGSKRGRAVPVTSVWILLPNKQGKTMPEGSPINTASQDQRGKTMLEEAL